MIVFFALLLIPIVIQHVTIRGHYIAYKKRNTKALSFFFFFLTILVMFRHESVGADTSNYMRKFLAFDRMSWEQAGKDTIEIGFTYFNKFISLFSKEPQFFLAVAAVTVSLLFFPTYKRLCVDASLTIVLYCIMSTFVMMFSGIRQMIAIGIGFIAYEFTRKKKLIPFILSVVFATTFHTSAFMLALMYPLYHSRITKKWLYVVVPVMALLFVFNRQIFSALGTILMRYTKYDASIVSTGAYTMLLLFSAFAIFSFVIPDEARMDVEIIGLRNFLLLSLAVQMFAPLHTIAMRMSYYYIIFIPLLIPKIIEYRSKRWNQVAIMGRHIMVTFFLIYFFMNAYTGVNLRVFPYHFFWEELI